MQLTQINIFPLKSARGISTSVTRVGMFGPEFDRRWLLVDPQGKFLTQRRFPSMSLIDVSLMEQGLQFNAPSMETLTVLRPDGVESRLVTVWNDECQAWDAGDAAADWFSRYLGVSCRLTYMPEDTFRAINPKYLDRRQPVSFADGFPFLLISEASLADLNSRLETPIEMLRFRPNLVVRGCEPFAEDRWRRIRIGMIEFDVVKPCSRCAIPNIDPATGERGGEPYRTLAGYRTNEFGVCFGQNLVHRNGGILRVGDALEVLESVD